MDTHMIAERNSRKISVGLIVRSLRMGGAERYVVSLAKHLEPSQFHPVIVCLEHVRDGAEWLANTDVPVHAAGIKSGNSVTSFWKIARILKPLKLDIVHSQNWGTLVETAIARRLAGVPHHVHVEHGTVLGARSLQNMRGRARALAMRCTVALADSCVAVASATRDRIVECTGIRSHRIRVIPNGVEDPMVHGLTCRDDVRRRLGVSPESIVVGTVARLAPVKNLSMLIEGAHRLAHRLPELQILIVGDGPERQRLVDAASKGDAAKAIHFVGAQFDVERWLSAMDVYVNCSLSEGRSLSIMEAMAAGLPTIVTDVGDNALLVGEGEAGIVIPSGDTNALMGAIEEMQDARRRATLGRKARHMFEKYYDIRRMVRAYEALYRELCDVARPLRRATLVSNLNIL